jgi:mannosyltransferase
VARSALAGSQPPSRGAQRAVLAVLVVAGAGLRFATLGVQSIWYDEAATAQLMRMSLTGMLRGVPRTESTPPLFYVLEWVWTRPFGTGAVGLRSMSAVIGTLTIALIYLAARRLLAPAGEQVASRVALASAAIVAFNPLLIWYSQEARAYSLVVALIAIGLWALPGACEGERRSTTVWGLASALAIAAHYFAAFLVFPELLWLLWQTPRRRDLKIAAAAVVLTAAALTPLALHQRARGGTGFIGASSLVVRLIELPKQIFAGYSAPGEVLLTVLAGLAVVIAGALAWRGRPPARVATTDAAGVLWGLVALAAIGLAVPLALALVGADYVITRNLICVAVPLIIVVASGGICGRGGKLALVTLCAVGIAVSLGVALNVRYQRDDWRDAVATVPRSKTVAVVILPASGSVPVSYYLPGARQITTPVHAPNVELIVLATHPPGKEAQRPRVPNPLPTMTGYSPPQLERHATFLVIRLHQTGQPVAIGLFQLDGLVPRGETFSALLLHGR